MKPTIRSLVTRSLLAAAAIPLLATGLKAQLPAPLINVDASALDEGAVAAPLTNTGTLSGIFDTDSTTLNVATTSGKKSFTFDGTNRLKASFTAPASLGGSSPYTVVATVLNPVIAPEEAYLSWSRRFPAGGFNAAQFNYGSNPDFGAVTHWGGPDMGFTSVPPANLWHTIITTFDGTTEKIYVNGALNAQEDKFINMHEGDAVFIGCSFNRNNLEETTVTELGFTGSLASVQVYGAALSEAQVKEASAVIYVTGQVTTGAEPLNRAAVSYATTPNPTASPLNTVLTDASGNYTLPVPINAGTVYVGVAADGYATSADSQQTIAAADINNVNFSLTLLPPLVDIDASLLADGTLTSLANSGSLGGNFTNDGTTVTIGDVAGKKAILFSGSNRMKSDFNAPATITGNSSFTVLALLHNPALAGEEAYLTWAQRGTFARCGQFNFANNADFGAASHWGAVPDIGFNPLPSANTWQWIAMTFDGATERIYVNGAPNASESKTLDLWPNQPFMLGASYWAADGTNIAVPFTGSMASLKVYGGALTQSQITALLGTVTISGNVNSGGSPIAGATVAYNLSPNPLSAPLGTALTDVDGNYSFGVNANSGTYYIAATKTGYFSNTDLTATALNSDITGIDFDLEPRPSISGLVDNDASEFLPSAAITLNTSPDGGTTLVPVQTVYTNENGSYLAYVDKNTTYYLTVSKSTHSAPPTATVAVTDLDESQDFTLTKLPRVLLVDLKAADLPAGTQTAATTWPNTGTLGGFFTASGDYPVASVGGRPAVDFTGTPDVAFNSSFVTGDVTWPSSLADSGDVQFSVVGWIQAPASTGTYLSFSGGTAGVPNRTFNSSWMFFRYNNDVAWGAADHGFSNWVGWTGTNTTSFGDFPATSTWHMIVNTYDGKSQKLYVDGVKQSTPGSEGIVRIFNPTSTVMRLGLSQFNNDPFEGYIHRVQVFDQPLSDTEVTQLWNDGAVTGTAYDTWLIDYPTLTGNDRAPDADPDFDGVANGIEFMLGTSPANGSSRSVPAVTRDGSGNLVVSFTRVDAAEAFPVVVESSTNLQPPWTEITIPNDETAGPPVTVLDNGTSPDSITVIVPGAPEPKKFARVKIVIPFTP